jgi:hypothetical protein
MPLSEGWRDQYERMHRSRARLAEAAGAPSGDDARDMLYDFFQDAYQLKDWIINDLGWYTMQGKKKELTQDGQDLESHITATVPLARCADICNGTKHLKLDRPRIPGKPAEVAGQGRSLTLPPFEVRSEFPGPVERAHEQREAEEQSAVLATYTWVVTWDGGRSDAVQLADQVIAEWDAWLSAAAQRKLL